MNPNSGENPNFEVQAAMSEQHDANTGNLERSTKSPENRPQSQKPVATPQSATAIALPSQITAPTFSDDQSVSAPAPVAPANNADRIEKQWVDRAKAVIGQTRDDPFKQKAEIGKVKAEYIKVRFNKTIKTDDPVAK